MARNLERLERLKAKLEKIPQQVKAPIKSALEKSADELVAMQQRLAPVDKGNLRQSIRKEAGDHELALKVKAGGPKTTKRVRKDAKGGAPEYDYALANEFGNSRMAAQPFFFPAYRALKKRIKGRLARAAKAGIAAASPASSDEAA